MRDSCCKTFPRFYFTLDAHNLFVFQVYGPGNRILVVAEVFTTLERSELPRPVFHTLLCLLFENKISQSSKQKLHIFQHICVPNICSHVTTTHFACSHYPFPFSQNKFGVQKYYQLLHGALKTVEVLSRGKCCNMTLVLPFQKISVLLDII